MVDDDDDDDDDVSLCGSEPSTMCFSPTNSPWRQEPTIELEAWTFQWDEKKRHMIAICHHI